MLQRKYGALKPFVIISLSYLLFTTTDGAVRMIVLLHAYMAGFSAWEVGGLRGAARDRRGGAQESGEGRGCCGCC